MTGPPSLDDDLAEASAYADAGPALSRETTRRLVRELTERTAGLAHLQRVFRLATQVEQRTGPPVVCLCTWSHARPGVRTRIDPACLIHAAHLDDGCPAGEPTEADSEDTDALARPRLRQAPTRDATSASGTGTGPSSAPRADLNERALVGGRPAAPTRDEVHEAIGSAPVSNENGPAGSLAEWTPPPWIWSATNAVVALFSRSATLTRDRIADAIESHLRLRDSDEVLGVDAATDAVLDLLSRPAAEPPVARLRAAAGDLLDARGPSAIQAKAAALRAALDDTTADAGVAAEPTPDENLLAQIEERRGDEAFMRRLRARIYQDRPLLDRLAQENGPTEPPRTQLRIGNPMCVCSHMRDEHDDQGDCKGEWRGGECFCDAFDEGDDEAEPNEEHGDGD